MSFISSLKNLILVLALTIALPAFAQKTDAQTAQPNDKQAAEQTKKETARDKKQPAQQAQAPDAAVHASRWLSGQLLRSGAVPEARLASLPGNVFGPAPGLPRDGTVVPAGHCLLLAEPQCADATRAVLASRNVAFQETPVGAWTGFAVAAAAWPAGPPPAFFWTGTGLLAGRRQP